MKVSSECRLDKVEQGVHVLQKQQSATVDQLIVLQYKSIDIEARSRRNNMLFRGIPETLGEDPMAVIQKFFIDHLELDPDNICIQRAHRIGRIQTRKPNYLGQAMKHRPLIIALCDIQDVELIIENAPKFRGKGFGIGIKRDFPFINIRKVPREVLKTESEAGGFQHLPRDLANVNEWQNHVWSLLCINSKKTHQKLRKCLRTLFFSLTTIFLCAHAFYKYPRFNPWPGTFSHDDLKA